MEVGRNPVGVGRNPVAGWTEPGWGLDGTRSASKKLIFFVTSVAYLAARDLANIRVYLDVNGGRRVLGRRRVAIKEVRDLNVRLEDVGSP